MVNIVMDLTCAILAGGLSRRMGNDKATMSYGEGPLIEKVYRTAKKVFDNIVILSDHHECIEGIEAPVICDILPVRSNMVGIASALVQTGEPYLFILGCDMPFVSEEGIRCVAEAIRGEDIVVPKTKFGFEPLHAVYSRTCIPYMLNSIQRCWPKIPDIFPYLSVKFVENHPSFFRGEVLTFLNINTREDLARARQFDRQPSKVAE